MSIRQIQLEVSSESPFANCKFGREKYAAALTSIIDTYLDGFVMAINGEWGTGKTTFVKMLMGQLHKDNYRKLYFNAWESDFDASPMVAIMAQFKTLQDDKASVTFKKALKYGGEIIQAVAPAIVKGVAKHYLGSETIQNVIEDGSKHAGELLAKEIKSYNEKKEKLQKFREELKKYIGETNHGKPVVFIVDELDRCRPDYAVEILEQIKHFFSVEGIVFVLAIDKDQLSHAIRGYYGSEQLNASEYLKRFIDLEFILPPPPADKAVAFFMEQYNYKEFFLEDSRKAVPEFKNDQANFASMARLLFQNSSLTLRQQEKVFVHARVAMSSFKKGYFIFPDLFVYLVYLKFFQPIFHKNINSQSLSLQDLVDEIPKTFPKQLKEKESRSISFLTGFLVVAYANWHDDYKYSDVLKQNEQDATPMLQSPFDNESFLAALKYYRNHQYIHDLKLDYLLDKINLYEQLLA